MALIKCPECGKEISDTADTCIHCGYHIEHSVATKADTYVLANRTKSSDDNQIVAIVLIIIGAITVPAVVGIILLVFGISMLSKKGDSNVAHECAYYRQEDNTIMLYSSSDELRLLKPDNILSVRNENDQLLVVITGESQPFKCGKCSKAETDKFNQYLEQIKTGVFKGL